MAQPEQFTPQGPMPPLPGTVETAADLDAEWGNQVVAYLGALNDKVDNVRRRLEAKIDGVKVELEAKIDGLDEKVDGVNDNIERLFQRVYPNVDFD